MDTPSPPPAAPTPPPVPQPEPSEEQLLAELSEGQNTGSAVNGIILLVVSLMIFAATGLFSWKDPLSLGILVIVLLVHEAGHLVAMKLAGYRNVRMLFIPMLGAAAGGQDSRPDARKQVLVSLAGPVPGIAIGFGLLVASMATGHDMYYKAATLFLFLNVFNLLPLYPLDGGHFFESLLFARHPAIDALFRVLTVGLLGLLALASQDWVLGMFVVAMLIGVPAQYGIHKAAHALRRELGHPVALSRATLTRIAELMHKQLSRQGMNDKTRRTVLYNVWTRANLRPPGAAFTVVFLLLYGAGVLATVTAGAVMLYAHNAMKTEYVLEPLLDGADTLGFVETETNSGELRGRREVDTAYQYHGRSEQFYPGGRPMTTGWHLRGKYDSTWVYLDTLGDTTMVEQYDSGQLVNVRENVNGVWEAKAYEELEGFEKVMADLGRDASPLMSVAWMNQRGEGREVVVVDGLVGDGGGGGGGGDEGDQ